MDTKRNFGMLCGDFKRSSFSFFSLEMNFKIENMSFWFGNKTHNVLPINLLLNEMVGF